MKQLTKLIFLLTSILTLSACSVLSNQSKKEEYEGYIERVSEVYPTEKVSELFKKFPKGFEIEHTRTETVGEEIFDHTIYLKGDAQGKTLTGTYEKSQFIPGNLNNKIIVEIPITYTDEEGMVTSEPYEFDPFAKSIRFLFTEKSFSRDELKKLKFENIGGNPILEDNFRIRYTTKDNQLSSYLGLPEGTELSIKFLGSKSLQKDHYQMRIRIDEIGEINLSEAIFAKLN